MEKLHSKKITKYITTIAVIIMLCNFVMPNYLYAKTDTEEGGDLLTYIAKFIAYLGDCVMQKLQDSFTSVDLIDEGGGTYNFQYSPAIIFSGTVPALDVNFFNPNERTEHQTSTSRIEDTYFRDYTTLEPMRQNGKTGDSEYKTDYENAKNDSKYIHHEGKYPYMGGDMIKYDVYYYPDVENSTLYIRIRFDRSTDVYYSGTRPLTTGLEGNYESTAAKLQETIATWYKALRRIALVGLLSVLIYVGIRIVLSSASPQEQAKYKKMMVDWLTALCLLFTLHYIMSITLLVVQKLSAVFNTGDTDVLLNTLRHNIYDAGGSDSWGVVIGEVIMYITLIIFTIIYTIQYMKRVVYMAFFTLIAPLVTLTYPLDKIKDGQAQAFNMWMREYTYNALVQVVHLVIYYVLVGSALDLVDVYPLYAIITLMFMRAAENVVKKMFGFDKAETVGAMGAALTGGLLTTAVTSMKKPPKTDEGSGNGGGTKQPRTAKQDPLPELRGAGNNGGPAEGATRVREAQTAESEEPDMERAEMFRRLRAEGVSQAEALNRVNEELPSNRERNASEQANREAEGARTQERTNNGETRRTRRRVHRIRGVIALGKRYFDPAVRTLGGAAGAAVGGTIGFAAGVAQGDIGKALGGAAGGLAAGYYTGQKGVNGVGKVIDTAVHIDRPFREVINTYREGKYGKEAMDAFRNAGITNRRDIENIMENNEGDLSKEIGYYTLARRCPREIYDDDERLEEYLRNLGLSETTARTMREHMEKYR